MKEHPARPASTVCAVRQNREHLEVLMVQRGSTAKFMAGAWVFPGGVLDPEDSFAETMARTGVADPTLAPWVSAAARELAEETGIWVTTNGVSFARRSERGLRNGAVSSHLGEHGLMWAGSNFCWFVTWVTPTMVPMRFEARFFAVELPMGIDADPDPSELDRAEWIRPCVAQARAVSGEWIIPLPTAKTLARIAKYESVENWFAHIEAQSSVDVIQPRMRVLDDDSVELLLPGEAGFDELGDLPPDPEALARAGEAARRAGNTSLSEVTDAS
jgi:recombination protein RecT